MSAFPRANRTALSELPAWVFQQSDTQATQPDTYGLQSLAACPQIPVPADTNNVNNLRPGNIRVVASMGDSITAGMSAKDSTILSMREYRGLAYSIGGDEGVTTLPNLLESYVPTGYPIGASTGIGKRENLKTNGFNAAVSGAINVDMLGQAQWLVQQFKANTKVNYENDWKLVTIWIGSNNLCDVCDKSTGNNGDDFQTQVTTAIQYLYDNVPRVLVNLVANLEISSMYDIDSGFCGMLHSIACGCVGSSSASDRGDVRAAGLDYQARAKVIAQYFNAKNNTEFAVVVQPFLTNTVITLRSQLSGADCFHPSAVSHGYAATALWNNLISPAAQKKTQWDPTATPLCASEDTLIYTD